MRGAGALGVMLSVVLGGCSCSDRADARPDARVLPFDGHVIADGGARDAPAPFDVPPLPGPDAGPLPDGGPDRECTTELCADGLDQDCDALVDEECACTPGAVASCFSGHPANRGRGECRDGSMLCTSSFEFGEWGPCEGDVTSSAEACDPAGLDEDCDGAPNDGCECSVGDPPLPCGTDTGECVAGEQRCVGGVRTECEGAVMRGVETCNAADDDCDGLTDEALVRTCGSDVGSCVLGSQTCDASGMWGACTGGVDPATETCNGADDDCDGTTDEGCDCITGAMRTCGTDVGACETGTETCGAAGRWGPCTGATGPGTEVCNAIDDDCDGMTDEEDVCPRFPPAVTCPGGESVVLGGTVSLMGSGSDPDGGAVGFTWSVVSRPTGSLATPSPPGSATTSFTPDVAGSYTLQLCVSDDEGEVRCCTMSVMAMPACTVPAAATLQTCGTSWDRRPVVEFAPLPAGVSHALYLDGEAMPYATVTMVGQNYHRPAAAIASGGAPPGAMRTIHAVTCRDSDPTCCAVSAPVSVSMIEECTTPIPPTASNIVFSEYLIDGDGGACPGAGCEAGEAIEITNLSSCPVGLSGNHFSYANSSGGAFRWMDFGSTDVIPPRGVYVAIRNTGASTCSFPFLGPDDPSIFGLKISGLAMMGASLSSGWFNNTGGGMSHLRIATGAWSGAPGGTTLGLIAPYSDAAPQCGSIGFSAIDECGAISPTATPSAVLSPSQLGRLWHPCDAVVAPVPASCM